MGAFIIVDAPALVFPRDAGPATASLEFLVGIVRGDSVSTWAGQQIEPCWIDLGNKDACISLVRIMFLLFCGLRRARIGEIVSFHHSYY